MASPDQKPKAVFKSKEARTETVRLEDPFEFGGVEYDSFTVRRMNGAEVMAFVAQARSDAPPDTWPNVDMPPEAQAEMSADDRLKLEEVALDFLPRRLREVIEQTPASGAPMSVSQPTS